MLRRGHALHRRWNPTPDRARASAVADVRHLKSADLG
jgi:hypothetical protein